MISKKYIIAAGIAATIAVGAAGLVFAENNGMMSGSANMMMRIEDMRGDGGQLPVLNVGPKGEVLMRGTVSAVSTGSVTVKGWGGDWVVNISSATKLAPNTTLADVKVGDFVGVQGTVSQSASWTIDATLVRDWTAKRAVTGTTGNDNNGNQNGDDNNHAVGIQAQINAILEKIKQIQAQIGAQGGTTNTNQ